MARNSRVVRVVRVSSSLCFSYKGTVLLHIPPECIGRTEKYVLDAIGFMEGDEIPLVDREVLERYIRRKKSPQGVPVSWQLNEER